MSLPKLAEVVEASTYAFTAQCYDLNSPPPLGALVHTDGQSRIYGVVSGIATRGLDPGRRPIALGQDLSSTEEVFSQHPQLAQLLRTEFQARIVGFADGEAIRQHAPPAPPSIHSFVRLCEPQEVATFTRSLDFLPLLLSSAPYPEGDEVVAAFIRQASQAHKDSQAFLLRAARELARLLALEPLRMGYTLKRLKT